MSENKEKVISISQQIKAIQKINKQQKEARLFSLIKDFCDIIDARKTLNNPHKNPIEKIHAMFNSSSIVGKYLDALNKSIKL